MKNLFDNEALVKVRQDFSRSVRFADAGLSSSTKIYEQEYSSDPENWLKRQQQGIRDTFRTEGEKPLRLKAIEQMYLVAAEVQYVVAKRQPVNLESILGLMTYSSPFECDGSKQELLVNNCLATNEEDCLYSTLRRAELSWLHENVSERKLVAEYDAKGRVPGDRITAGLDAVYKQLRMSLSSEEAEVVMQGLREKINEGHYNSGLKDSEIKGFCSYTDKPDVNKAIRAGFKKSKREKTILMENINGLSMNQIYGRAIQESALRPYTKELMVRVAMQIADLAGVDLGIKEDDPPTIGVSLAKNGEGASIFGNTWRKVADSLLDNSEGHQITEPPQLWLNAVVKYVRVFPHDGDERGKLLDGTVISYQHTYRPDELMAEEIASGTIGRESRLRKYERTDWPVYTRDNRDKAEDERVIQYGKEDLFSIPYGKKLILELRSGRKIVFINDTEAPTLPRRIY